MASNLEFREGLKAEIGERAAKMIAEAIPVTSNLATKDDIAATKDDIAALRLEMAEFRTEVHALVGNAESRLYRWMLSFNLTLFLGVAAMIVTLILNR